MKQSTSLISTSVPPSFLNRCDHSLTGVLSGFDRLRLRGTLRYLFQPTVMEAYLNACRVLIKDFGRFANDLTARVKAAAYATAEQTGRPFRYLPRSQTSKEDLARQIARADGVTTGLIAIFSALENCLSYSVRGNRQTKHIPMVLEPRKCLHLYHYFQHEQLGLCHVRVQTWFPFTVDIGLNGRDWLARQMDAAGVAYRQGAGRSCRGARSPTSTNTRAGSTNTAQQSASSASRALGSGRGSMCIAAPFNVPANKRQPVAFPHTGNRPDLHHAQPFGGVPTPDGPPLTLAAVATS